MTANRPGGPNPLWATALHDLDLTGQLALDRPMLVARINRPGAQLVLGELRRAPPRSIRRPCSGSSCP